MGKTKEERLIQQRMCKRRKYMEIKNDPELYALEKEKQRAKYEKRKKEKKQLPVAEKSPREQRKLRKQWKENSKKYRQRQKEKNTLISPPCVVNIQADFPVEPNIQAEDPIRLYTKEELQRAERRVRYRELKKRIHLTGIVKNLQKTINKQKMTIIRLKSLLNKRNSQENNERSSKDEDDSRNTTKKGIKRRLSAMNILKSRKDTKFRLLRQQIIESIEKFYNDDAVSTICAGKKEFITKKKVRMQKRYLTAPLKKLHKKLLSETNLRVSYSFFTKHRPFWVLPPKPIRDTCLCAQHTNMELLIQSLHNARIIDEKTANEVVSFLCCDPKTTNCLLRQCILCKDKVLNYKEFSNDVDITYFKWGKTTKEIVTKNGQKKKQTLTVKDKITTSPLTALNELEKSLNTFFLHIHNIESQYTTMKYLKENLLVTEAVIHVDFSENYSLKFAEEVQSFHFGGSRQQVSLHTSVIYTHDFSLGNIKPTSICTISDCVRHDAAAIWAHLIPLISKVTEINPFITTLHFLSDSPISQYRNKFMFYIITRIRNDFGQISRITWNYTEAGHGKGAPDGVGAVLKRTADRMVNFGRDVGDFDSFCEVLKQNVENIIIITVKEDSIKEKERLLPKNLKPFRGTLSVHQILWHMLSQKLTLRKVSCFLCDVDEICIHGKHLGFYEIMSINNKNDENEEIVTPLAATARPKRIFPSSKIITVLSDITYSHTNINALGRPSASKE